jgi:hypothetical protein
MCGQTDAGVQNDRSRVNRSGGSSLLDPGIGRTWTGPGAGVSLGVFPARPGPRAGRLSSSRSTSVTSWHFAS